MITKAVSAVVGALLTALAFLVLDRPDRLDSGRSPSLRPPELAATDSGSALGARLEQTLLDLRETLRRLETAQAIPDPRTLSESTAEAESIREALLRIENAIAPEARVSSGEPLKGLLDDQPKQNVDWSFVDLLKQETSQDPEKSLVVMTLLGPQDVLAQFGPPDRVTWRTLPSSPTSIIWTYETPVGNDMRRFGVEFVRGVVYRFHFQ